MTYHKIYRDTWIEVNLNAIQKNVTYFQQHTNKEVIFVAKANAYSHGDEEVCRFAHDHCGITFFGVSSMHEALRIRRCLPDVKILTLGYTAHEDLTDALRYNVSVTIPSLDYATKMPVNCAGLHVHIKVDTGMSRLGCRSQQEVCDIIEELNSRQCYIEGIFSHYSSSDDNPIQCEKQQQTFRNIVKTLPISIPYIHLSNTDGALDYADDFTNAVRIGLGVYGFCSHHTLEPALGLYSKITMIKKVPAGTTVSYGCTYSTTEDEWIATIPIGYADGWVRSNQGRNAIIQQTEVPFVGRICMDQCMLSLPRKYPIGTTVELIGPHMLATRVASELNTIVHEILCLLSDRIPRIYIYDGTIICYDLSRFSRGN